MHLQKTKDFAYCFINNIVKLNVNYTTKIVVEIDTELNDSFMTKKGIFLCTDATVSNLLYNRVCNFFVAKSSNENCS